MQLDALIVYDSNIFLVESKSGFLRHLLEEVQSKLYLLLYMKILNMLLNKHIEQGIHKK